MCGVGCRWVENKQQKVRQHVNKTDLINDVLGIIFFYGGKN